MIINKDLNEHLSYRCIHTIPLVRTFMLWSKGNLLAGEWHTDRLYLDDIIVTVEVWKVKSNAYAYF